MDPFEASNRRREAQRRLWAKRRRLGQLRGRVVAVSLIGFVFLWCVVFTQMATGNDPVLSSGRKASASAHKAATRKEPAPEAEVQPEPEVEPEPEFEPEPEVEAVPEEEVAPEVEPEPEVEPAPEFFEPEPVETAQS